MLVNPEFKFAFIHAPKCAGMSLSRWLVDHYGFTDWAPPGQKIEGSELIERHRYEIPAALADWRVVTCIRDPFARWESFYLYYALELQEPRTFAEFTRDRLEWLPLQVDYTARADYILRVDQLAEDVRRLPFVDDPVPPLPNCNVSKNNPSYETARREILWTDLLVQRVRDYFAPDFRL